VLEMLQVQPLFTAVLIKQFSTVWLNKMQTEVDTVEDYFDG
jgi:hypothetical protein